MKTRVALQPLAMPRAQYLAVTLTYARRGDPPLTMILIQMTRSFSLN